MWMTPEEVARVLSVDVEVVEQAIDAGQLRTIQLGAQRRIHERELQRFLRSVTMRGKTSHGAAPRSVWIGACAMSVALLVAVGVLKAAPTTGAGPHRLPYRGYLEDASGPIDGSRRLTFCLSPSTTASDPDQCPWYETHDVSIVDGAFTVMLGATTPLDSVMASGGPLYLGLTIEAGSGNPARTTLTGRQAVGSSAFAWRASPATDFVVDGRLSVGGDISMSGGGTIDGNGRMHLASDENIYLLSRGGTTYVSSAWGGAGNLAVSGDVYMGRDRIVRGDGNQHLTTTGDLYLLPAGQTIVGAHWGGTGNLTVQGTTAVGADLAVYGNLHGECYWQGVTHEDTPDGIHYERQFLCNNGHFMAGVYETQRSTGDYWGHVRYAYCCRL